jgi:hypothetical protein
MTVNILTQTTEVLDVVDVVVTTIEQLDTGKYVRELRIMTQNLDDGETAPVQRFVLRLVGDTLAAVHVTSPSQEF